MAQAEIPYQEGMHMHHPHSWLTKYWFSQDHKVIAVQYGITAMAVGLVALVLSDLMRLQIGFPGLVAFITTLDLGRFGGPWDLRIHWQCVAP